MAFPINPPTKAIVDVRNGYPTPEFYRFLAQIWKLLGTSAANPFDDNILIALQPLMPAAVEASAEASLASAPAAPVEQQDPLAPPAMPFSSLDDSFLMTPYRLPPGA